jgi:hypothetical protein
MNLIGLAAQRYGGRKNLGALDTRAQALREQARVGSQAEMQQNEALRQQEMQFKRELNDTAAGELRGPLQPYVDDQGNMSYFGFNSKGTVNERGEPDAIGDRTPWTPPQSLGSGGKPYAYTLKEATPKVQMLKNLEQVREMADQLDEDDLEQINRTAKQTALEGLTPNMVINYVRDNYAGYSPEVKRFFGPMLAISAQARHRLAGAALTEMEKYLTDAFLPSATGISMEERMGRIGDLWNQTFLDLEGVDQVHNTDYSEPFDKWKRWKPNYSTDAGLNVPREGEQPYLTPKLTDLYDRYYRERGSRHPNDPRANAKVDKRFGRDLGEFIGEME